MTATSRRMAGTYSFTNIKYLFLLRVSAFKAHELCLCNHSLRTISISIRAGVSSGFGAISGELVYLEKAICTNLRLSGSLIISYMGIRRHPTIPTLYSFPVSAGSMLNDACHFFISSGVIWRFALTAACMTPCVLESPPTQVKSAL